MCIEILTFSEIRKEYGFGRDELTHLLNTKGCPVLPRKHNAPYKVVKEEFEKWLKSCRR